MTEYLTFVDEIGITSEGEFIYRFDFSLDKDIVWGEYWNIAPAVLVPGIKPDKKCLSKSFKITSPYKLETACKNSCFSMQDCIDGIIALCFPDIEEPYTEIDGKPLFFNFGEEYDLVISKLNSVGFNVFDEENIDNSDKNAIENFVEDKNSGLDDFGGHDYYDDDNNDNDNDF